jgi:hypothetical protein
MRRILGVVALAAVGLALALTPARGADDEAINQAIDKGIAALKALQKADGSWPPHGRGGRVQAMGATALAGLTLLECNISGEDPAVARAAAVVRAVVPECKETYSLATAILFLDKLGDPKDIPLIEVMGLRLLAGQMGDGGGWHYGCPEVFTPQEVEALLKRQAELVARLELPRAGEGGRTVKDLAPAIQEKLNKIQIAPPGNPSVGGDNSNTQFAALALWVARRYGVPVDHAMSRVEVRFRTAQNPDGGWSYAGAPSGAIPSTPTMTCAGVLALEISYALTGDGKKPRNPDKDQQLALALQALGSCVGVLKPEGRPDNDRFYYFVWSLERVCVILGRNSLGGKDWYKWGADVVVHSQTLEGLWKGEYGDCGADTCFALLFLKKANLARDLTARIRGKKGDRMLHAGNLKDVEKKPGESEPGNEKAKPGEAKATAPLGDTPAARLAKELLAASEGERPGLLRKFRDGRGPEYTEALSLAISRMDSEVRGPVREALATRLARMQAKTLLEYLKDEDTEVRRAAAKACGMKRLVATIPALIRLLRDSEDAVKEAAHESLKALAGGDLGAAPEPWEEWLKKRGR